MDITGWLVSTVLSSIVGNRADAAVRIACGNGLKAFLNHQKRGGRLVNYDLQRAIRRSFLSALQTIALECHAELVGSSLMRYRGQPVYPPQHRDELQWLDLKLKQLVRDIKQIERIESIESPLSSLDEIEALLTPSGKLASERMEVVKEKLLAEVLSESPASECYAAKVKAVLFERVCDHFASEIKHNQAVGNIFESQLLAQINANLSEQKLRIQDLENSLSQKTFEARWQVKLEVNTENLDTLPLEAIVEHLRELSGDISLTIRRIEAGSIVLVFEGSQQGFERIEALFKAGQLAELLGVRIEEVRSGSTDAPLESLSSLESASLTGSNAHASGQQSDASVAVSMSMVSEVADQVQVNLSQWLQSNFAEATQGGWLALEEIFGIRTGLPAFRSKGLATVRRAKLMNFGNPLQKQAVALLVELTPSENQQISVLLQVYPMENVMYLPKNLTLSVVYKTDIGEVQAQSEHNCLEMEFFGQAGEEFSVQVALGDISVRENFVI